MCDCQKLEKFKRKRSRLSSGQLRQAFWRISQLSQDSGCFSFFRLLFLFSFLLFPSLFLCFFFFSSLSFHPRFRFLCIPLLIVFSHSLSFFPLGGCMKWDDLGCVGVWVCEIMRTWQCVNCFDDYGCCFFLIYTTDWKKKSSKVMARSIKATSKGRSTNSRGVGGRRNSPK